MIERSSLRWTDVAGLNEAKLFLQEAVPPSVKLTHLFTGSRKPTGNILLIGAPGTGKTLLANALSNEASDFTFFALPSSYLLSKPAAESVELVKNVFEMGRKHKPSVIFFDEIDYMRSSHLGNESESARRIKAEFLEQTKGGSSVNDRVLVLGATCIPWVLDATVRKRYSGGDISVIGKNGLMVPVRKVQSATNFKWVSGPSHADPHVVVHDLLTPCSPGERGAQEMSWLDVPADKLVEPIVTMADMLDSLANTECTTNSAGIARFESFLKEFGQED